MTSPNRISTLLPIARRVLHVDSWATSTDINRAMRTLSRTVHPDRPGGTNEAIRRAQLAADILNLNLTNQDIPNDLATQLLELDAKLEAAHAAPQRKRFTPDPRWVTTPVVKPVFVAWA